MSEQQSATPDSNDALDHPPFLAEQTHPRSIRRRLARQPSVTEPVIVEPQVAASEPAVDESRPRQPLPPDVADTADTLWRYTPLFVVMAVLAWITAVAMLVVAPDRSQTVSLLPRVLLAVCWALAALLTFVPLELRFGISGLAWQGTVGWTTLGIVLAFVPAPSGWLLDLPELPVYLLLFVSLFFALAAAATPIAYLIGQRVYTLRMYRMDVGRARRQGYECALLVVALLALAALRSLNLMTFALSVLVIVLTEALLLSQMQPEA